jgi:hypothetical protein
VLTYTVTFTLEGGQADVPIAWGSGVSVGTDGTEPAEDVIVTYREAEPT